MHDLKPFETNPFTAASFSLVADWLFALRQGEGTRGKQVLTSCQLSPGSSLSISVGQIQVLPEPEAYTIWRPSLSKRINKIGAGFWEKLCGWGGQKGQNNSNLLETILASRSVYLWLRLLELKSRAMWGCSSVPQLLGPKEIEAIFYKPWLIDRPA